MLTAICYCVYTVDSKDHIEKLFNEINETHITEPPAIVSKSSGNNTIILPIHGWANNDAAADKKTHATKKARKEDEKKKKDARITATNKVAEKFFCQ